jgi:hypothetical protein
VIYDEIKDGYQDRDFINAIEDVMSSDSYKITGPSLQRRLNLHKTERIEREHNAKKEQERQEIIKLWDNNSFPDICQNHKCGSCDRVRCDEIARATISYIKEILFFEPEAGLSIEEQIEQKRVYREAKKERLIRDFPGIGFEKSFPRQDYVANVTMAKTWKEKPKHRADIDDDFVEEDV